MRYTIWRIAPDEEPFPITSSGNTTVKEVALEKAEALNRRLLASDPDTSDRFVVQDERGRVIKSPKQANSKPEPTGENSASAQKTKAKKKTAKA